MDCPICGGAEKERFRVKYVNAAKCAQCGHLFAVDVASDHGVQEFADPDRMLAQYGARNQKLVARWGRDGFIAAGNRVLDFGAGSGHVLRSLVAAIPGLDIHCVEAGPEAAAVLRTRGFTVLSDLAEAAPASFDAILLIELLEHLDDPVGFMAMIGAYLKPGGRIFMSTPIGETRSGNRNLQTYDTAEHVQFWTEPSFALACRKAGFAFSPIHAGVMYPRTSAFDALARDTVQSLRDAIQGRRHLVGYLTPA
jgi:2-polyprenyl-3-methyl-5-hydroxy-6-metoxy-1,4-benzoquinol methylase